MKDLKMRTMKIVPHMKLMESFGATPVPIGWLELYTSLQTNVVAGEETTLQNIVMGKLYQVQKHLTLTGHLMGVGAFLCNEQWYQSLPDDLREALVEAEMTARLTYDGFGELLDTLALDELSEKMQIYSPTAEQMKMFRQAARPYVTNWMKERPWVQQEPYRGLVEEFLASIEAVEEQLAERAKSAETAPK
jgi:C4-dicarboxylate-binding protein DctP